jgi:hypothetical protein
MSDNVGVYYGGNALIPPPFVSRTQNPLDYGKRWGFEDDITLKGQYLVTDSGDVLTLANLFTGQFSSFQVKNTGAGLNSALILNYPYTVLDSLTFDSNHFFPNTYVPYTARLKAINVPSGVVEPSNEYSFSLGEDGLVTVNHKISARGIVTSSNFDSALQNAKKFVQTFTGSTPFSPAFVPKGFPVLVTQNETLDRLSATYTVNESYKYNSGEYNDFYYTQSLDIDQSLDADYISLNFSYNRESSTITGDVGTHRANFNASFNLFGTLANNYKLNTGRFYLNSYSISEQTGKNVIAVTANIISGVGDEYTGYFDYDIDLKWDKIIDVRQFTINGKFASKAPVYQKRIYLQNFKNLILSNSLSYQNYLYNILTGSAVNTGYCSVSPVRSINPIPTNFSINENTGLAEFSMSASFNDKDYLNGISETSFTLNIEPPKNLYEFKPSANIEGVYVIQDLQTLTRETVKTSINVKTTGDISNGLSSGISLEALLSGNVVNLGAFLIESGFNTGVFDLDLNTSYYNTGTKFSLDTRHYYSSNPQSLRPAGYKWGL